MSEVPQPNPIAALPPAAPVPPELAPPAEPLSAPVADQSATVPEPPSLPTSPLSDETPSQDAGAQPPAQVAEAPPPHPLASAPLSVLLIAQNCWADDVEEAGAGWLEYLRGLGRGFEVILLDDGANAAATDRLAERFLEIRVVHHSRAQGLGRSLREGLALAQHPLVFYSLCNKQYCPADLSKLLEQIVNVQVVTGRRVSGRAPWWLRFADLGQRVFCRVVFGLPLERRLGWLGWKAARHRLLARWLFGLRFHDPESMFCLLRREIFTRIPIQSRGSFAPVEILAKANFLAASGMEVPVSFAPARPEPSFFQEALRLFQEPDFGPASLEPAANEPEVSSTPSVPDEEIAKNEELGMRN